MKKLITEADVRRAQLAGEKTITLLANAIITPSAQDAARAAGIAFSQADGVQKPAAKTTVPATATRTRKIVIGADHGGYEMKTQIIAHLRGLQYEVADLGTYSEDAVDYPDIAHAVAKNVAAQENAFGIIIDGAGIGSAMVANKIPGIRAANCNELFAAVNSREHNGANVLTLGGRIIGIGLALKIVDTWLQTDFGGGRHQKRLQKMMDVDQTYRK